MPDYRGGNYGMSQYGAEAAKAIAEGRTERQRDRDFRQKAIMAAVQAGLTGLSGVVKANESSKLQRKQAQDSVDSLARQADATPARWERQGEPNWSQASSGDFDPTLYSASGAASDALERQKVNNAAAGANIGGVYTKDGLDKTSADAGAIANDIDTSMQGIRSVQGINPTGRGMMGSY